MRSGESMTLLEAVGAYSGSIKAGDNHEELHRELYRFVNWCGSDRVLSDIGPPEVGEYADHVAGSGTTPQAAQRLHIIRDFLSYAKKKGLVDTNLAQHVRIRKSMTRAGKSRAGGAPESVELTHEGHAQMVAQMKSLRTERAALAIQIQKAAADKDVRENVPLEAAREQSGHVDARIRNIEETLKSAVIIDSVSGEKLATVKLGARVSVKDLNAGRETTYTLVHRSEANSLKGKISDISPLGRALVGRAVGEEVEVQTPRGKTRFRILEVWS